MTREQVIEILAAHRDELRAMNVRSLDLFGSTARGEATPGSDVDLLVEFDRAVGLFQFVETKHRIEEMLSTDAIDLVLKRAVRPELKGRVLAEAIRVL